jgi:hypothetical protein
MEQAGIHVAAICGRAADGKKATGAALHQFRDSPQASVRGESEIEGAITERLAQRRLGERIGVDVFDAGRNLGDLMAAGMQHRDIVAAMKQSVDDKMAGRPGSSDDKRFHESHFIW